jgi:Fe-S cluster assembly protein SufD
MPANSHTTIDKAITQAYAGFDHTAGGGWLQPIRDHAMQAFAKSGFPTRRDEDWKYTDLTDVEARSAAYLGERPAKPATGVTEKLMAGLPLDPEHYAVVFANGIYRADLSRLPRGASELSIETLGDADEQLRERIVGELGQFADVDQYQLAALNTAFLSDALVLRVPENTDVARPVHVVFATDEQRVSVQARILIHVSRHSRVTLVEHHVGRGAGLTNAVTEASCAEGAHLRYIKIQDQDPDAYHLAAQHVQLAQDSQFDAVHLDFGARIARNDLAVRLSGHGATAQLHGLFVVDGQRHVDNHTRIDHVAAHTTSRESYRGIINDKGRGIFNGKIIVHAGADGTDAQLNNRNLLLSPTAEIDTKPELEIYTDDVKCSHGTTTGQIDSEAMFYLRSRGVPENEARRLLVLAFATEVVTLLNEQMGASGNGIAQYIEKALEKRLPK